jgi:protein TonB
MATYPQREREAGRAGATIIQVIIDARGLPEPGSETVLAATDSAFADAAARVVAGSCFSPAKRDGQPVRVRVAIPINFTVEVRLPLLPNQAP